METAAWATRRERLVVIGGGQAAAQMIEVARRKGYEGRITLVTEEAMLPYQRPPLSKQYLTGQYAPDWLLYRPEEFYGKFEVDVRLAQRATAIERVDRVVRLQDGGALAYDKLALATGARARVLAVPGAASEKVFYIRTLADVERLRPQLPLLRKVVIIGAGFIGLEAAAMLVQRGIAVTLIGAGAQLIPRLVGGEMAAFLLDQHLLHGVKVVLRAEVRELRAAPGGLIEVNLGDGRGFAGDAVLVGIGAAPNTELAEEAGLHCENGIIVDEMARTSDPAIVAAGDCTNHPNALVGRRLRLETVHNAVEQGRSAGATIAGCDLPYAQSPWVWSDQYKFRLQSVGIADGYDRTILRGTPASGRFSLFYYRGDDLLALNSINEPLVFGAVRRILNQRIPLRAEMAADTGFDLARLPARKVNLNFDEPWPDKAATRGMAVSWGFS